MTTLDLPAVLSLVAHELRSPASVIAGCARMLNEGRLNEEDRLRVYGQIGRAADRVTTIGQQSSDVARWLRDGTSRVPTSPLPARSLLDGAIAQSRIAARVTVTEDTDTDLDALCITALDRAALITALSAVIDLVGREVADVPLSVTAYANHPITSCDILVGPAETIGALSAEMRAAVVTSPPPLEAGGMGLALVVCAAVVAAHDGHMLALGGRRDVVGLRLRALREA
jgi:K+-sensing histidine kinase KdpD